MLHVIVVALGGAVGNLVRYSLGRAFACPVDSFPWLTLLINVLGCGLLGLFFGVAQGRALSPAWSSFISVGVLGGFTTFSLFGYETLSLWLSGRVIVAGGYVASSITAGLLAMWSGYKLGAFA